jgi:hypothetical protein
VNGAKRTADWLRKPFLGGAFLGFALACYCLMGCGPKTVAGTDAGNADKAEKVAGIVVDMQNHAVNHAAVYLRTANYRAAIDMVENGSTNLPAIGNEYVTHTDNKGAFIFALTVKDTGQYIVESGTEGFRGIRISFHRDSGESVDLGRLRLEALGRIMGNAKLPQGGIGDLVVSLTGAPNGVYLSPGREAFDFQSIPAGKYTVRLQGVNPVRNPVDTLVEIHPGDTLHLDLLAGPAMAEGHGTLAIQLLRSGSSGRNSVSTSKYQLKAKLVGIDTVLVADSLGNIFFPKVPAGTYTIVAWGESPSRDTVVKTGIVVSPGLLGPPVQLTFKLRALIVDGIANHDWLRMTRYNKTILEESGLFEVAVSTLPPDSSSAELWSTWHPNFSDYDVVILHCNSGQGDDGKANPWPDSMKTSLENFVSKGGGLVNTQATFPGYYGWPAFEVMHGLLWRNREFAGPSYHLDSMNTLVVNPAGMDSSSFDKITPGGVGELITVVNGTHPINAGLPAQWRHPPSALVYRLKGSPEGMTVLAYSVDPVSGSHEPQQWTKNFGLGRAFTTVIGDLYGNATNIPLRCAGYQTTFVRGTQWAALGKVTLPVPGDFPGRDKISLRSNLKD